MADSIFTKIIRGEILSYKIYEDDKTFAFLDIHPVQPGMTLVVTKEPYETFLDLPDEERDALFVTVQKVAKKMHSVFPAKKRIAVQIEGLDIPHVHVKILPIDKGEDFRAAPPTQPVSADELAAVAAKLAF